MAAVTEAESIKIYEAERSPAFQAYIAAGATDEAFAVYSAAVGPMWDAHLERIGAEAESPTYLVGEKGPEEFTPGSDDVDYEDMKVPALRELLESRGLDSTGVKADLIDRLLDDDESDEDAPPAE